MISAAEVYAVTDSDKPALKCMTIQKIVLPIFKLFINNYTL